MPVSKLTNATPPAEQVPMVVVDDGMPQVKDVSPLQADDVPLPTEAFPPVPEELPILIQGDLASVGGATIVQELMCGNCWS